MKTMLRAEALVLRTIDFSETSLIVNLLTREHGKIAALAKGAKRLKGPFETSLDVLAEISVAFIQKNSDALNLLTESKLVRRFRPHPKRLAGMYAAYWIVELLDAMLEEGEAVPSLFAAAIETIRRLENGEKPAEELIRFEWKLLVELGHRLSLEQCASCSRPCDLTRDRILPISAAEGGVLCPNCRGSRGTIPMHASTMRELVALSENNFPDGDLSEITLRETRVVLNAYFYQLLDHQIAMCQHWKEIFTNNLSQNNSE